MLLISCQGFGMYCELHEDDRSALTCHNPENNKNLFVIDG